jgi:branched-chain amino acid aminotransferase
MTGNFFWFNNQLESAEKWDKCQASQGTVVYEVLRIIDRIPLFFEDHYLRLINSCRLIGQTYEPNKDELHRQFLELATLNGIETGNVTLKVIFGQSVNLLIYLIPHSYPTDEQYRDGVTVGLLEAERVNPEAKIEQGMREKANKLFQNQKLYEVLLVDTEGFITEGSRSNMVFVKENKLYTCPLNKVLTGITLKKTLEIAAINNIPVVFEAVHLSDIASFDALFMTGTSPKILPVASTGNINFDVNNPMMRLIMRLYDQTIERETCKKQLSQKK